MVASPPTQYATDANLAARQRLWTHQERPFDLIGWVLGSAGLERGSTDRVLDVGCGNGAYLRQLRTRGVWAVGCDRSRGMLTAADDHPHLVNADAVALPFPGDAFDVVLAPHMLYHVPDRRTAAAELQRVLRDHGRCVVVTNGSDHLAALRRLVEEAVRVETPGWEMRNPSTHEFSLENGGEQLAHAFETVEVVRPDAPPVQVTDASVAADYVASVADHYQPETTRPWTEVVEHVRAAVRREIEVSGAFVDHGRVGAFLCR